MTRWRIAVLVAAGVMIFLAGTWAASIPGRVMPVALACITSFTAGVCLGAFAYRGRDS